MYDQKFNQYIKTIGQALRETFTESKEYKVGDHATHAGLQQSGWYKHGRVKGTSLNKWSRKNKAGKVEFLQHNVRTNKVHKIHEENEEESKETEK